MGGAQEKMIEVELMTGHTIRAHENQIYFFPIEIVAKKPGRYLDYVMIYSNARNVTNKGYKVVVVATAK